VQPAHPARSTVCSGTYSHLNVGAKGTLPPPVVGTNPFPNDAFQDTVYASCSMGAVTPFGLHAGCWGRL
jgi:hypothetical protein